MNKKISVELIKKNCLIASIAHALFTCNNPDWDFLQSWDNNNYSIQDAAGTRGTISFYNDFCIGCFRNDKSRPIKKLDKKINEFSDYIKKQFITETSQYLLDDNDGVICPVITSLFFCSNNHIKILSDIISYKKNGISICYPLFERKFNKALQYWKKEYDLNDKQIDLLIEILNIKITDFNKTITLDNNQLFFTSNHKLNEKIVQTFRELKIEIKNGEY